MSDSETYLQKKAFFNQLLTIYGRKPVLEAIQDPQLLPQRLHLSNNNRRAEILDEIEAWAVKREIETKTHAPKALARISKNAKQDQGVALDVRCPNHIELDEFLNNPPKRFRLIGLDGITNPQNLGMIIRSVAASPCDAIILGREDTPKLSPLVIKASAGSLFRAPIIRCNNLLQALNKLSQLGTEICVLDSSAKTGLDSQSKTDRVIYVLGNETEGVSSQVSDLANQRVCIEMNRGVESLNVAVTAALVAFYSAV